MEQLNTEQGKSVTFGAALTFPIEHPAIRDPEDHRPAFSSLDVDGEERTIIIRAGGYIDGPVTMGEGWTLKALGIDDA